MTSEKNICHKNTTQYWRNLILEGAVEKDSYKKDSGKFSVGNTSILNVSNGDHKLENFLNWKNSFSTSICMFNFNSDFELRPKFSNLIFFQFHV